MEDVDSPGTCAPEDSMLDARPSSSSSPSSKHVCVPSTPLSKKITEWPFLQRTEYLRAISEETRALYTDHIRIVESAEFESQSRVWKTFVPKIHLSRGIPLEVKQTKSGGGSERGRIRRPVKPTAPPSSRNVRRVSDRSSLKEGSQTERGPVRKKKGKQRKSASRVDSLVEPSRMMNYLSKPLPKIGSTQHSSQAPDEFSKRWKTLSSSHQSARASGSKYGYDPVKDRKLEEKRREQKKLVEGLKRRRIEREKTSKIEPLPPPGKILGVDLVHPIGMEDIETAASRQIHYGDRPSMFSYDEQNRKMAELQLGSTDLETFAFEDWDENFVPDAVEEMRREKGGADDSPATKAKELMAKWDKERKDEEKMKRRKKRVRRSLSIRLKRAAEKGGLSQDLMLMHKLEESEGFNPDAPEMGSTISAWTHGKGHELRHAEETLATSLFVTGRSPKEKSFLKLQDLDVPSSGGEKTSSPHGAEVSPRDIRKMIFERTASSSSIGSASTNSPPQEPSSVSYTAKPPRTPLHSVLVKADLPSLKESATAPAPSMLLGSQSLCQSILRSHLDKKGYVVPLQSIMKEEKRRVLYASEMSIVGRKSPAAPLRKVPKRPLYVKQVEEVIESSALPTPEEIEEVDAGDDIASMEHGTIGEHDFVVQEDGEHDRVIQSYEEGDDSDDIEGGRDDDDDDDLEMSDGDDHPESGEVGVKVMFANVPTKPKRAVPKPPKVGIPSRDQHIRPSPRNFYAGIGLRSIAADAKGEITAIKTSRF